MAYRAPGQPNLYPRDAVLNLPLRRYSWCLQRAVVDYNHCANAPLRAAVVQSVQDLVGWVTTGVKPAN